MRVPSIDVLPFSSHFRHHLQITFTTDDGKVLKAMKKKDEEFMVNTHHRKSESSIFHRSGIGLSLGISSFLNLPPSSLPECVAFLLPHQRFS
jgi:hypothetical protein